MWPVLAAAAAFVGLAAAADWPTYRHDNHRSGITPESIPVPLGAAWTYAAPTPPQTAWTGPAKWDAYANIKGLASMRNFDPALFVIAVGEAIYFGSSVDDAVYRLRAATGEIDWVFSTDGPVRLPPTWHAGRVYFGSDDGHAYCVEAGRGSLVWKHKPSRETSLLLSNGKLISRWPCRTGVLVQDAVAYFAASLLPWEPSFLCAVDAATGVDEGPGRFTIAQEHLTMQGAMLASPDRLYIPQGRQRPEMFDRHTGQSTGSIGQSGQGGVFALITQDNTFLHGRGQNHAAAGELRGFDARSRDYFVTFPRATRIVVTEAVAFLNTGTQLAAFDRARYLALAKRQTDLSNRQKDLRETLKKLGAEAPAQERSRLQRDLEPIEAELEALPAQMDACFLWQCDATYPHDLILAGDTLFAGGDDAVAAFARLTGKRLWQAPVDGKAHGLAAAGGRLFVSTDRGKIHCFSPAEGG